jgi:hypothetical protein
MAKGKKPTGRKNAAAGKGARKPKPKKRAVRKAGAKPGPGHNNPPPEVPPPPRQPNMSWHMDDQSAGQIVRDTAARQRRFIATTGSSTSFVCFSK